MHIVCPGTATDRQQRQKLEELLKDLLLLGAARTRQDQGALRACGIAATLTITLT